MTCRVLYNRIREMLEKAGCDSPAFDAACLLEDLGGARNARDDRELSDDRRFAVEQAAAERANGRPLQYILGKWDFLRLTLEVGEGVLIPRPETELLCLTAAEYLRARAAAAPLRVFDLCAGTGCVGLGLASLLEGVEVTALELSPEAFAYLERNAKAYPAYAVTPVLADVCRDAAGFPGSADAILSNPPYIPQEDLPGLQREVQREPRMALDGGDGLRFYRAIAADWLPKLAPGGLLAVEVGIGQAEEVATLFEKVGLREIRIVPDLAGIGRVVRGVRP